MTGCVIRRKISVGKIDSFQSCLSITAISISMIEIIGFPAIRGSNLAHYRLSVTRFIKNKH